MSRYRVSMDIGGTFTDVVAYDEATSTYVAGKSSTTPHDLTEGVFAALLSVVQCPADSAFTGYVTTQGHWQLLVAKPAPALTEPFLRRDALPCPLHDHDARKSMTHAPP